MVSSSVAVSSSSMGDSTELVVLRECEEGLALIRFLLVVSVALVVLVVAPVSVLQVGGCEVSIPANAVPCEGGVVVRTWLSLHTECLACCSCAESWEKVYWRMLACVHRGAVVTPGICEWTPLYAPLTLSPLSPALACVELPDAGGLSLA